MNKSENITELIKALGQFQKEAKPVIKDKINPYYKSKYADLAGIIEHYQPLLSKNGLVVTQTTSISGDITILTTVLAHTTGEYISGDYLLDPKEKNNPQAMGSAITYARRYALSAILGIVADEDDDGNVASVEKKAPKSPEKPPKPKSKGNALVDAAVALGGEIVITNAGELYKACHDEFCMQPRDVDAYLGAPAKLCIDFDKAYHGIKSSKEKEKDLPK